MISSLPVKGYQDQPQEAVDMVNNNKIAEEEFLRCIDVLAHMPGVDGRWLAIGRTHIEQGFMAINRAIFKPQRVKLERD